MRIGTRLTLGFALILLLMIGQGVVTLNRLKVIDNQVTDLVRDKWPKTVLLNDIHIQINIVARALRNLLLTDDSVLRRQESARILAARDIVTRRLDKLATMAKSDEGKELLKEIVAVRSVYQVEQQAALELIRSGAREQATARLMGPLRRAQTAYFDTVQAMLDHQGQEVERLGNLADDTYHRTVILVVALLSGAVILGALIARRLTLGITTPLAACVAAADKIAAGDTEILLDSTAGDETGALQGAMGRMVAAIQAVVGDAGVLTRAAIEGRLSTRVDATRHRGEFRQIVLGVNETLDAVIGPLNVAAEYVDRISKGDIPPRITDSYSGDFKEIKLNLNRCTDIMNNLLSETNRVLLAAAAGRLDERADTALFTGDWRLLVAGVNDIVTNIVNPLRHTTALLNQEIAERSAAQELQRELQHQLLLLNSQLEERVAFEVRKNQEKQQALMQREKMASLGQLAAGVAHEINNPMGFITSNLGVLADYFDKIVRLDQFQRERCGAELSPQTRELVSTRRRSLAIENILADGVDLINESLEGAERVTRIVKDLKSFSRVDELEYDRAALQECLESALNLCNNELHRVATIRKEYQPLPMILCHPAQLNQVFLNLLVNAGEAINPPGEIVLRSWCDGGSVYASVRDTGRGIPPEVVPRIFEPFFTTKEVGQGTGLGLSIAYEIIATHKGELTVESVVGVGTTFTVKLPRTQEQP